MTEPNDAPSWGRLYTAMVTPMTEAGGIDVEQAQSLAAALLKSGSDGVVVAGTTGESPTLTHEEERVLFRELAPVVHEAGGTLIAGTGSNSTETAVEASEQAAQLDVDGLLQVVPYYNKPSQEGLYQHFKAVADAVPETPIMLYNVPGRTGLNMSAQTTVRLAEDCPEHCGGQGGFGGPGADCGDHSDCAAAFPDVERERRGQPGAPGDGRVWRGVGAVAPGGWIDQGDVRRVGAR